eukprot:TRINITY_DN13569_c0_g1_i1.p1 TRINITY_DN13569_c0_g1~~TRINITY_DN13569_c0_g1_i1.p1  ORF type:complete len:385 (+),score=37.59 TRINITY_DN13569_c0_g1_i1:65-1219(+)
MEYESMLIRVPLGGTERAGRLEGKRLGKEWAVVQKALKTLLTREEKGESNGREAVLNSLSKIETKLKGVKRKWESAQDEQQQQFKNMLRRSLLTRQIPKGPTDIDRDTVYLQQLTYRLIAQYLLRNHYLKSVHCLAKETNIKDFIDIHIFEKLQPLQAELDSCTATQCLSWCGENRSRLAAVGSTIELQLRQRTCLDIAKESTTEGMLYCKKHIAPLLTHADEAGYKILKKLVRLCVMSKKDRVAEAEKGQNWSELSKIFVRNYLAVHKVPDTPLLLLLLQAGLLCLNTSKTPPPHPNIADPMTSPLMQDLVADLPVMARRNSVLVCPISGCVMDDSNPPMVTPVGYLYSKAAVDSLVQKDGKFICPQTGYSFPVSYLKKAFVM